MSSMNQNALRELLDGFEEEQSDIFFSINNQKSTNSKADFGPVKTRIVSGFVEQGLTQKRRGRNVKSRTDAGAVRYATQRPVKNNDYTSVDHGEFEVNMILSASPLKQFEKASKYCISSTQMTKPTAVEVGSKMPGSTTGGVDYSSTSFAGTGSRAQRPQTAAISRAYHLRSSSRFGKNNLLRSSGHFRNQSGRLNNLHKMSVNYDNEGTLRPSAGLSALGRMSR